MKVEIPPANKGSGLLRSWASALTKINSMGAGPAAFEGRWLERGHPADLRFGAIVILYDERGSSRKPWVRICRVEGDGSLYLVLEDKSVDWPRVLRDKVPAFLLSSADPIRDALEQIEAILDSIPPGNAAVIVGQLKARYGEAIP